MAEVHSGNVLPFEKLQFKKTRIKSEGSQLKQAPKPTNRKKVKAKKPLNKKILKFVAQKGEPQS